MATITQGATTASFEQTIAGSIVALDHMTEYDPQSSNLSIYVGPVPVPVTNADETVTLLLTATIHDSTRTIIIAEKVFKFTFKITHCACKTWKLSGQKDVI